MPDAPWTLRQQDWQTSRRQRVDWSVGGRAIMKPDAAIVIVEAGHAGVRAAHTLRAEGWMGKLILLCAEPDMPYERPPLSKAVLLNAKSMEDCRLFDSAWYWDNEIDLRLGTTASE